MPTVSNVSTNPITQNSRIPKKYVDHPTYTEYFYETAPTTGKKVGVGIASAFITGLGQCINGEWGKGIGMFAGGFALKLIMSKVTKSKIIGDALAFGIGIVSIIDAVKHAKSETVEIVPKQNSENQQSINYSA